MKELFFSSIYINNEYEQVLIHHAWLGIWDFSCMKRNLYPWHSTVRQYPTLSLSIVKSEASWTNVPTSLMPLKVLLQANWMTRACCLCLERCHHLLKRKVDFMSWDQDDLNSTVTAIMTQKREVSGKWEDGIFGRCLKGHHDWGNP